MLRVPTEQISCPILQLQTHQPATRSTLQRLYLPEEDYKSRREQPRRFVTITRSTQFPPNENPSRVKFIEGVACRSIASFDARASDASPLSSLFVREWFTVVSFKARRRADSSVRRERRVNSAAKFSGGNLLSEPWRVALRFQSGFGAHRPKPSAHFRSK